MRVREALETLENELDNAKQVPLSGGKVVVNLDQFRDLLREIKNNFDYETREAEKVVRDRSTIINNARSEANVIIKKAEERASLMVSEEVITKQAQARANEMLTTAQTKSNEIRKATNEYVERMLVRMDELLSNNLANVRKTRETLKNNP